MKAQKPALGISLSESWGDTSVYLIDCSCTDSDHAVTAWIEIAPDEDLSEVEVTFYIKTNFRRWERVLERVKLAWGILWGKGHEQHHSLLLRKQAALNFAAAIEASIEDLENRDTKNP
jgi:hypothetical protein